MNNDPRGIYAAPGQVDLFGLFRTVWRRRVFVLSIGLLAAGAGLGISFLIPPSYEASTSLRPVQLNQLDALNRTKIYSLPPSEALKRVGATLDSYTTRLEFFRSRPDLVSLYQRQDQSVEQAFQEFNSTALSVTLSDPKKTDLLSDFITIKLTYGKDVQGASVLNDFVDYALERERVRVSKDLQVILNNRLAEVDAELNSAQSEYQVRNEGRIARLEEDDSIKRAQLEDELKALRIQLKLQRQSRLAELDEAIGIAASLGLRKPSTPSLMADEVAVKGNVVRTEVNDRPVPLYFMGTEVLEAERAALRKRGSDDFMEPRIGQIRKELSLLSVNRSVEAIQARQNDQAFLEGIESLRVERGRLQSIDTQLSGLQLVAVDQRAVPSVKPVKPRKSLIVVLAFIGGLMIGIMIALIRAAYKSHTRRLRDLGVAKAHILAGERTGQLNVLLPEVPVSSLK
ncbi:Wzz/FepE/Etk N-terminal domain-containing protein [Pseudomonas sp. SC11]|uniref:Wzz/FepE/Etk N-terminal domain-containing protein n=1 Tax=Pseudomonas sp. SC11 TaxID=326927 RepID=UPI003999763A